MYKNCESVLTKQGIYVIIRAQRISALIIDILTEGREPNVSMDIKAKIWANNYGSVKNAAKCILHNLNIKQKKYLYRYGAIDVKQKHRNYGVEIN